MIRTQVAIIGAGPAGLAAAVELAQEQVDVLLIDEQEKPGGQLVKQIHKFFGSHKHYAGIRGIEIADQLFSEAKALGMKILVKLESISPTPMNWASSRQTESSWRQERAKTHCGFQVGPCRGSWVPVPFRL
jgi:thioredoxin reductase